MKLKKYRCVLFDLDGTLMNTASGIFDSVKMMIDAMQLPSLPDNVLSNFIGPPIKDSLQKYYHLDEKDARYGVSMFRKIYLDHYLFDAHPYEDILSLLKTLKVKGISIGVATNKGHGHAVKLLEEFDLAKYCDSINGSDTELKLDKAGIINLCLEHLDISDRSKVVYVGDSSYDAIGSASAGIDFVGVTYGFGFRTKQDIEHYPHVACAHSVQQLKEIINVT
jgi:phosphoglycolate phosphatase